MGSQFLGLIFLILAVAAGVYIATNYAGLVNLRIPVPSVNPFSVPSISPSLSKNYANYNGNSSNSVLENQKPVKINYIRQQNSFGQSLEFSLYANLAGNESVNITGWTVKSNDGSFSIPQAQEVYSFGGAESNINLQPGDKVNFYPTNGLKGNFRLNKCMGYLEEISPFSPSLPKACPYVSRSEITNFSGACQEYVLSLRSCQEPSANPPVPITDSACRDFLRKFNYIGCVEKYGKDKDFSSNDWRVWIGNQLNIFDPLHDKVQLLDRSGKVVDEYTY